MPPEVLAMEFSSSLRILAVDPLSTIQDRGIHVADEATGLFVLNI